MAFHTEIAGAQIDGARDYQEDAFLVTRLTDVKGNPSTLIIVADGMGGHAAGNVASNMAVQAFNKCVATNYPSNDISTMLNESILKANGALTETIKETSALGGMGCTMVSGMIEDNRLWWASVGDSHLYLLRNRKLTKLNADHSYGGFLNRMESAGTPVAPEKGLSRNMLMSAITGDDIAEIDCPTTPFILHHKDRLIICTDGMDTLSEGKIIQYTDWADNPKECSDALLKAVEDIGSPKQDNTTAVVTIIRDESAVEKIEVDEDITEPGDTTTEMEIVPGEPKVDRQITKKLSRAIVAIIVISIIAVGAYFVLQSPQLKQSIVFINQKIDSLTKPVPSIPQEDLVTLPDDEVTGQEAISQDIVTKSKSVTKEPTATKKVQPAEKEAVVAKKIQPTAKPVVKKEFQDNLKIGGKGPAMLIIPSGSFKMGSPSSSRFAEERPQHEAHIESFAVSKYEITFAEYELFAQTTGRKLPKDNGVDRITHPAFNVTWDDAYYYTKWLNEQTGKKYRLLSESEWEYAASGGKKTPFWWGYEESSGKAHCFGCNSGLDPRRPTKTGYFEPNQFGVHDTAGNVAEWVKDCWHKDYHGAPSDNEVWEGGDCKYRIVRGGAYSSPQQSLRTTKRDKLTSSNSYDHVGIRVARKLDK